MLNARHLSLFIILALIAGVTAQIWFGRASVANLQKMREEIETQQTSNELLRQNNERLLNDITDLREGREKMEEFARAELGMIRPNEIFVQYVSDTD